MDILGLHLSGPKTQKTAIVILRTELGAKKSYLSSLDFPIIGSEDESDDIALVEYLNSKLPETLLCVDTAISDPPLFHTDGNFFSCENEESQWMNDFYLKNLKIYPKLKIPCAYIQRPSDFYLRLEHSIDGNEPLSSNHAPRWIRWKMISKNLQNSAKVIETLPRFATKSFDRVIGALSDELDNSRNIYEIGKQARAKILQKMQKQGIVFIKDDDFEIIINHLEVFDAFFSAMVGKCYLESLQKECPLNILKSSWPAVLEPSKVFKFYRN